MNEISLQEEVEIYVKSNKILKKDFAQKIGITPVMLSHWLKGRLMLNYTTLDRIVAEINR